MKAPLSMAEQVGFIENLVRRCRVKSGDVADETWLRLTADEVDDLQHIATRLGRMAPREKEIKKLVMGK